MKDKADFKVKLGDLIQLQYIPDEGRERLNAKVIGHSPNRSIIITAPSVNGKSPLLRENQRFIVRMMQGVNLYGFESEVLRYYASPYPHVHLSHPKDIESKTVRGSRRVNTELIVSVQKNNDEIISASMLNTSSTGSLVRCNQQLGAIDDELLISAELNISGQDKYLRIPAIIRNLTIIATKNEESKSSLYKHGVQFINLDEEQILLINAYVHEQLIKQLEE
ncbi:MAG: flagellar brake protein [Gammaproteobacteria bacterium]|nr:flagellar brake protein [Gammaproteobacteria bacterium]